LSYTTKTGPGGSQKPKIEDDPLDHLDADTRVLLIRFVCAMAWTDLEFHPKERDRVFSLVDRLELTDAQRVEIAGLIKTPPPADDVDPQAVPLEVRKLFLDECRRMAEADGIVRDEELETLELLESILTPQPS
jgi:uncharacterized tellurite resistance protein B-like protein